MTACGRHTHVPTTKGQGVDRAAVKRWVEESCAKQGVPAKVTSKAIIARVAEVLRCAEEVKKRAT
jgi:hypothetical protein